MKLWLDAQLPPLLAHWINEQDFGLDASPVRELGLRDASDAEIFAAARSEVQTAHNRAPMLKFRNSAHPPPFFNGNAAAAVPA